MGTQRKPEIHGPKGLGGILPWGGQKGEVEWSSGVRYSWVLLPSLPTVKSANLLVLQFPHMRNEKHRRIAELLLMSRGSTGEGPKLRRANSISFK